jgi:hypothetical protein
MSKFSKQMIELQAWQEFELEYLIEPEPELDPHYARIIEEDAIYGYGMYPEDFDFNDLDEEYQKLIDEL